MTPADLIRETRSRKGLSQRRLALRAGTSQSAIARIEAGTEEVTWPRLRAIMVSMGEEPVLSGRRLESRYDAADLLARRGASASGRLDSALAPREILLTLAEHGVDFVVIGGVAVQAHGHGRSTRDLDLIPRPDLANLSRLAGALAVLGARLLHEGEGVEVTDPQLLKRAPLAPLLTDHGRLSLRTTEHTSGAPTYDALRQRSIPVEFDGCVVRVAGLDDLLRMKRAGGRDVDLDDVGALTRSDEELEREAREST